LLKFSVLEGFNMFTHPLLLIFPFFALSGEPTTALFENLTVSKVYPEVQITHYSATPEDGSVCDLEGGIGGPNESPSGFRPLSHRIDRPGPIYGRPAVLTAVTQEGGTRGAYRCFFSLPDAYPGRLFFGGDFYGPDSNDMMKTDISSPCTSIVNVTKHSRMVVYDCGSRAAQVGPLYSPNNLAKKYSPTKKPAPIVPSAPKEEAPGECLWYAVASCDRSKEALLRDQVRIGDEFKIIRTNSVPSFSRGWYCLVSESKGRDSAAAKVRILRKKVDSAYVKKGC
jgi:hypothetical protein